jgi:hypothetical protein
MAILSRRNDTFADVIVAPHVAQHFAMQRKELLHGADGLPSRYKSARIP